MAGGLPGVAAGRASIPRPELTARLVDALDRGALLLVAGAGFGKTTALEQAVATRGDALVWITCSPAHADPGRLLGDVVDSVRTAVPGAADVLWERLSAGTQPVDIPAAARALAAEFERLLVEPLTIAFDEAESLAGGSSSIEIVNGLLAARSAALRIAVATRRPLPLRTEKLRAAGRLTELGAAELAFSPDECARFLQRRTGSIPSEQQVAETWSATEGWPLAVALIAVAEGRAHREVSGSLAAFLSEEVLDGLPERLREELIDSAVAPDLDSELAAALGLAPDFLEQLAGTGLPLRRLDAEGGPRWRHHPLVRDAILERLERERPEARRRELHRRCAEALEAAGRGLEAVDHWLAAAAPSETAAAVARHGSALARTSPDTVAGWLARVPEEARAIPELRVLVARLAAGAGHLDGAIEPLEEAVAGFSARGDEGAAWFARAALADTHTILEDFERAIPLADGWESSTAPAAPMVAIAAAAALAGATRYREASELFASATRHPFGAPLAPFVRGFHGFWVDLQCGRLDAALEALRDAAAHLEREDPFDRLPYVIGMQAVVLEERGEDSRALATMERSRRAAEDAVLGGYFGDVGHRFAAGVHARAGRLVEAERELQGATGPGLGWYPGDVELTRATIAAARGSQAEAAEAAEGALAAGALSPWRARWRNTARLAPVLAAAGRVAWAGELVDEALGLRPPHASCARLLAVRAWLRRLEGDEAGSLDDFARAWEEAGDEVAHLVRRERPRAEPLLWTALERGALAPADAIPVLEAVEPGGGALVAFTDHPAPEVRRSALRATAASGHPRAHPRLEALERDPDPGVADAARAALAVLAKEPPRLAFSVLGGFVLRRGMHIVGDEEWGPRRRAAQRLVRFLLARRDAPVPEDDLFSAFWPDASAESARRGLQVTVSSARATLDFPGAPASVIEVADRRYRLALREPDLVDADEFEATAESALAAPDPIRIGLLEAAAERWTGEPLPEDRYEDWAAGWRERLVDVQRRVLGGLADARGAAGDLAGAVEAARRQVELDPLDESAHRRLMLAYARAGRRGHALRQYLACRRALVEDLALEPAAETAELQRRILAGEAL